MNFGVQQAQIFIVDFFFAQQKRRYMAQRYKPLFYHHTNITSESKKKNITSVQRERT